MMMCSDIDCVVAGDVMIPDALYLFANRLCQKGVNKIRIQVISRATVPIVKFTDPITNCQVDVSFGHLNGCSNSLIVKQFLKEFSELRPLVLILKYFLQQRDLNEPYTGGLGSYALSLMVVCFLQHTLPLFNGKPNLGILLRDFLKFFGRDFNYCTTGISVRKGGCYFSKVDRGWFDANRMYLLAIEDPNDTENDVGKNSFQIRLVRRCFQDFYAHLCYDSSLSYAPTLLSRSLFVDPNLVNRRTEHIGKLFPGLEFSISPRLGERMCPCGDKKKNSF
eukprot:TRINITY_DN2326_c0_g1_i6.p1 TRINITY_DN2326_c0_g1~~TRINITY_DN2326_c0_g1_i6.p1  ORF type:complete len:278 (-),score=55.03 TRINITY_DN2326_c0_g1_i6:121-954(-)